MVLFERNSAIAARNVDLTLLKEMVEQVMQLRQKSNAHSSVLYGENFLQYVGENIQYVAVSSISMDSQGGKKIT